MLDRVRSLTSDESFRRTLLVEDNVLNQRVLTKMLTTCGFEVDIANNGMEAARMWKENPKKYAVILMDLKVL
jgi:CheY-like chemotaxis protein